MNGYDLSRGFFNWCFENPDKITPNHIALYFFCIEHCNRLGWKGKFGLPTTMAKEAVGIRSYNTYIKTLNELVEFGFIKLIEKSKNQYSSNIIALSNFNKAPDKALDKALIKHVTKHMTKQRESTIQSICSIDKPLTINNKPLTNEQIVCEKTEKFKIEVYQFTDFDKKTLTDFIDYWTEPNKSKTKLRWEMQDTWETKRRLQTWINRSKDKFNQNKKNGGVDVTVSKLEHNTIQHQNVLKAIESQ